jgi:hypothetical protein
MSHRRTRVTGIAFGQSLWRGIALVAGVVLIGLVSSVPSASALLREAAGTVGSTVRSVQATANTPPSLPSLPRATPPATPTTPAAPQVPGQLPTQATPTPSPSSNGSGGSTGSGGDLPSAGGITGAARSSLDSVTSTRGATATQAAASAGGNGGGASVLRSPAGAGKATPRAIGTASSAPLSVSDARVALQHWFARVWPAIALGGSEAGRDFVARLVEEDLFRPVVVVMARLLSLAPPTIRAAAIQAAGDSPLVRHPVTANEEPQLALPDVPAVPVDQEKTLYLIASAALLATLAFMLRGEFRSTFRAGVHRWHRLRSR